jgi:hypothetical protein
MTVRVWRTVAGFGFCATGLLACQLILGIEDDRFTFTSDAATDAPSGAPPDECAHAARAPAQPDVPDDGEEKRYIFAFRTVDFAGRTTASGANPSVVPGYDLDGVCTCDLHDRSKHGGLTSCVAPAAATRDGGCDDDGGIDNVLGGSPELESLFAGAGSLGREAECGRSSVIVVVDGYNGQRNDSHVLVSVLASFGIQEGVAPEDAGVDCTTGGGGRVTIPARWDGTDRWSTQNDDFDGVNPKRIYPGWVSDYKLVMDSRRSLVRENITVVLREGAMSFGTPILTARLTPSESDPSRFRLEDGILTGRISADDMLDWVGAKRVDQEQSPTGYLCDSPTYALVKPFVCNLADTVMPPQRDFTSDRCNALSVVLRFTAPPAQIGATHLSLEAADAACTARPDKRCTE